MSDLTQTPVCPQDQEDRQKELNPAVLINWRLQAVLATNGTDISTAVKPP